MKLFRNILTIALVLGFVSSCDLDKQVNPNEISPEQASLNDLYNQIQLDFRDAFMSANYTPGAAARMYHAGAFTYRAFTTPNSFNGLWGNAYNNLFPNVDALVKISEGKGFDIHVGTALVMKAYTMMLLVDVLGDVPYSEALQGTDIISPKVDTGADVYAAADQLLTDAIALLGSPDAPAPAFDNYYGGDASKWIKLANTIKLRAAVNNGDASAINTLVSAGNLILSAEDDFQFNYGSQRNNPNSRHPYYNNHYEVGDGNYLSNYFMWMLRGEKNQVGTGNIIVDPRIRYYFYRKVDDAANQDATTYSCHFSALPDPAFTPAHYLAVDPDMPYCIASADGYSGRDHLNGEGIPPDGPIRTSYGLYPFGGDFDDDSFNDTRENGTTGGLGEGIAPIMLSSYVHFMIAEAAENLGASGDPWTHAAMGIRQSLEKVKSFESLVASKMATEVTLKDGSQGTIEELYGMIVDPGNGIDDMQDYIDEVEAMFLEPGADQLDVIMKEFYIAAWGNGIEAYNMYRRTGKPGNMMPGLEPPGAFPLSFFYPSNSETRNSNITQKSDLDVPVFWQDATVAAGLY